MGGRQKPKLAGSDSFPRLQDPDLVEDGQPARVDEVEKGDPCTREGHQGTLLLEIVHEDLGGVLADPERAAIESGDHLAGGRIDQVGFQLGGLEVDGPGLDAGHGEAAIAAAHRQRIRAYSHGRLAEGPHPDKSAFDRFVRLITLRPPAYYAPGECAEGIAPLFTADVDIDVDQVADQGYRETGLGRQVREFLPGEVDWGIERGAFVGCRNQGHSQHAGQRRHRPGDRYPLRQGADQPPPSQGLQRPAENRFTLKMTLLVRLGKRGDRVEYCRRDSAHPVRRPALYECQLPAAGTQVQADVALDLQAGKKVLQPLIPGGGRSPFAVPRCRPAAGAQEPDEIAHAGQGLKMPGRRHENGGSPGRVDYQGACQLHPGGDPARLIGPGGEGRYCGNGVVEGADNKRFVGKVRVGARNYRDHGFGGNVAPHHVSRDRGTRCRHPRVGVGQHGPQHTACRGRGVESRQIGRRREELLRAFPAMAAFGVGRRQEKDGFGAEVEGANPAKAAVVFEDGDGSPHGETIHIRGFAAACVDQGPGDSGWGYGGCAHEVGPHVQERAGAGFRPCLQAQDGSLVEGDRSVKHPPMDFTETQVFKVVRQVL